MIPMFRVRMAKQAASKVAQVLNSGMVGEGPKVAEFTEKLKRRFGCYNLIPLNSCTSAITLALRLAGAEGGEVISTPFTMVATNVAIRAAGAKVVFADIEENGVNISIDSIKEKITPKTRAVVVTYVGGIPCEMEKLQNLGVPVIADAAQAVGTYYKGLHISNYADYSCFSFQSIKQLTTGDGGAITIADSEKYELAEKLKWFGMTRKVPEGMTRLQHQMTADVEDWGYKYHMNDIAAAIGLANLELLNGTLKKHNNNATYFLTKLPNTPGIRLPLYPKYSIPSWYAFYLFVDDRESFMKFMEEKGIETTPMWRRNDEYSAFKGDNIYLPNMTKLQNKIVFIPVGWWLSRYDLTYIVHHIKEWSERRHYGN